MAKINLTDIATGYELPAAYNANNSLIETFADSCLSRDGTAPNQMEAQLDMNSNRIINLADGVDNQDAITLAQAGSIAGVTNPITATSVGDVLYPTTTAETSASATVVNSYYPEGVPERYQSNPSPGSTDMAVGLQAALDVMNYKGGGCVQLQGKYATGTALTMYGGTRIQGCGTGRFFNPTAGQPSGMGITALTGLSGVMLTMAANNQGNSGAGHSQIDGIYLDGANFPSALVDMTAIKDEISNCYLTRGLTYGVTQDISGVGEQRIDNTTIVMDDRGTGLWNENGSDNTYHRVQIQGALTGALIERGGHQFTSFHPYPAPLDPGDDTSYVTLVDIHGTGDNYFVDCHFDQAYGSSANAITGFTSANPAVATSTAHGMAVGDTIRFDSLPGDFGTNLDGVSYIITAVTTNTFTINVDASGYAAYTTGGNAQRYTPQVRIRTSTSNGSCLENVFIGCSFDNPNCDTTHISGLLMESSTDAAHIITASLIGCHFSGNGTNKYKYAIEKGGPRFGDIYYEVIGGYANNATARWNALPNHCSGFPRKSGAETYDEKELTLTSKLIVPKSDELTIATGVITATDTLHRVDTEADAASDDLDTITAGEQGQFLILMAQDSARTVVCKDGTGNLALQGDFSMENDQYCLGLVYMTDQTEWVEMFRSAGGSASFDYTVNNHTTARTMDADDAAGAISASPTQAEVENIRDAVLALADTVGTLITDLASREIIE
jgi:hypothetical protein